MRSILLRGLDKKSLSLQCCHNSMDMIVIIALKGTISDLYNLLTALRTVSSAYAQMARAQSCANHVQHIERLSRATCSVPLGSKGQLSNLV